MGDVFEGVDDGELVDRIIVPRELNFVGVVEVGDDVDAGKGDTVDVYPSVHGPTAGAKVDLHADTSTCRAACCARYRSSSATNVFTCPVFAAVSKWTG
jgi:hypothetical protein